MRGKLQRFADNAQSKYVIEPGKPLFEKVRGRWRSDVFNNNNELVLELGCGKGEYTIGLAEKFGNRNFIGIDIKGDRIWVGSQQAEMKNLPNAAFLRTEMAFLPRFFKKNEVDEIWLTFPDPRPKKREIKRRLTHTGFMAYYAYILQPGGWFKFKTDNTPLFEYTLEVLEELEVLDLEFTFDLYQSSLNEEHHGIKTKYEALFHAKGESIKYLKFRFNNEKIGNNVELPHFIGSLQE